MRIGYFSPPWLILGPVLLAAFLLNLRYLDHTSLTHWDEVFHAVVAQNVLKHPFKPTLIDVPYLPYDYTNWRENHVWLHKPILPLWQIALSFSIFGVNTFALRLPSAILSMGAATLTYLIGNALVGRGAALIAAVVQAASPFLLTLVQGYQFADHIDIALLFWVEVGFFFLLRAVRTGSWTDVTLSGIAQGLAFLSKSYLAFIILGVALVAWLLPLCRLGKREDSRLGALHIFVLFYMTLLIVAPWLIHCLLSYPSEFWAEEDHIWKHLTTGIASWGAPWTRVVFDYLIAIYGVFYTPILVAGIVFAVPALAKRNTGLSLAYAWGLGVIVPHLFATTKTPSATLLAMPPLLLLLGYLITQAWQGEIAPLAVLTGVLAMNVAVPASIKNLDDGSPNPNLAGVMDQSGWVLVHVAGALEIAALAAIAWLLFRYRAPGNSSLGRYAQRAAILFCLVILVWLGCRTGRTAWLVTSANLNDPYSVEVGRFARAELPANAVLLCEEYKGYEHLATMFYADRTCYALTRDPEDMAERILQNGGIPYVVTYQRLPLVPVYVSVKQGPTVYRWQRKAP
jgi:4-amino-4-deoxy-L-arabinose transferase-like glycosyltransferase